MLMKRITGSVFQFEEKQGKDILSFENVDLPRCFKEAKMYSVI